MTEAVVGAMEVLELSAYSDVHVGPDSCRFLSLPAELRLLVYEKYFSDDGLVIGTKYQPRTKHATEILFTNRLIHHEAKPIMLKTAFLSFSLARKHAPTPHRNFAYMIDHHFDKECRHMVTAKEDTMHQFERVQLVLDEPSSEWEADHWQYVRPLVYAHSKNLKCTPFVRIRINVGRLAQVSERVAAERSLRNTWRALSGEMFLASPGRDVEEFMKRRETRTDEELQAEGYGRRWTAAHSPKARELFVLISLLWSLARLARRTGGLARLEVTDRSKAKVITANTLGGLFQQAAGLDDGKDLFLVIER